MAWLVVLGVLVWIGLAGLAGWVLGRHLGSSAAGTQRRATPLETLEYRYGRGEMGQDEFDDARGRVREDDLHG